jgi:D-amino-acid dehydrogenase
MIVPSHFVPLAAPGIVTQGIKWMFDSSSPFYIKPSLDARLLSWGWFFWRSATHRNVTRAAPYLRDLNLYSKALYEQLATEPGFDFGLEKKGILMYFKTAHTGDEEIRLAAEARALGLDAEALDLAAVRVLEPGLEMDVLGAIHYRCDAHLSPGRLVPQLITALRDAGVDIRAHLPVTSIVRSGQSIASVGTHQGPLKADRYILTGGARLPDIAALAGLRIPLMPGKGYSFTVNQGNFNIPAILCEARVAITPMDGSVRYGGTMEIAPINDTIRRNRVEAIAASVTRYFPGIQVQPPEDVWYGFRPCSPDGLPYIGYALDNLLVAGGHSMMGLSLGPATGHVIADLASGLTPEVRIDAFRPDRF